MNYDNTIVSIIRLLSSYYYDNVMYDESKSIIAWVWSQQVLARLIATRVRNQPRVTSAFSDHEIRLNIASNTHAVVVCIAIILL